MMPLKCTPVALCEAIRRYRAGESVLGIAANLRVDWSNLYKAMRKAGVVFDQRIRRLTAADREQVISRYSAGEQQSAIADSLGVDRGAVRYALRKAGVKIRSLTEAFRKLSLDESAFDAVTEESAYWVGYLMADGNIRNRKGRPWGISLTTSSKDESHLLKFRAFINSGHALIYGPYYQTKRSGSQRAVKVSVTSERMASRLAEFGVVRAKTHTARVRGLEENRHFWRGVIDGDGTVRWTKTPSGDRAELKFYGSRPLAEQFRAFCLSIVPDCCASIRPGIGLWIFSIAHRMATPVIKELYGGCRVASDRKNTIAQEIIRDNGTRPLRHT